MNEGMKREVLGLKMSRCSSSLWRNRSILSACGFPFEPWWAWESGQPEELFSNGSSLCVRREGNVTCQCPAIAREESKEVPRIPAVEGAILSVFPSLHLVKGPERGICSFKFPNLAFEISLTYYGLGVRKTERPSIWCLDVGMGNIWWKWEKRGCRWVQKISTHSWGRLDLQNLRIQRTHF